MKNFVGEKRYQGECIATAQTAGSAAVPDSLRKCGNPIGRLVQRIELKNPNVAADDCAVAE